MRFCFPFFLWFITVFCAPIWASATLDSLSTQSTHAVDAIHKVKWEEILSRAHQKLNDIPKAFVNDYGLGFFIDPETVPNMDHIERFLKKFDCFFAIEMKKKASWFPKWFSQKKRPLPLHACKDFLAAYREAEALINQYLNAYLMGMLVPYSTLFFHKKQKWGTALYRICKKHFLNRKTIFFRIKSSIISLGNVSIVLLISKIFDVNVTIYAVLQSLEFYIFYFTLLCEKRVKVDLFKSNMPLKTNVSNFTILINFFLTSLDGYILYKHLRPIESTPIRHIKKTIIKPRIQKIKEFKTMLKKIKEEKHCLEKTIHCPPEIAQIIMDFLRGKTLSHHALHTPTMPKDFLFPFTKKREGSHQAQEEKKQIKKLMKQRVILLFVVLPMWLSYFYILLQQYEFAPIFL